MGHGQPQESGGREMPLLAIVGLTIVVLAVVGIAYESHRYAREKTRPELPQDHPVRVLPWWERVVVEPTAPGNAQYQAEDALALALLANTHAAARYSSTHQPYDWARHD